MDKKWVDYLSKRMHDAVMSRIPDVTLNGAADKRYPGNLNFSFAYVEVYVVVVVVCAAIGGGDVGGAGGGGGGGDVVVLLLLSMVVVVVMGSLLACVVLHCPVFLRSRCKAVVPFTTSTPACL